jgi:hypothetical protein
MEKVICFKQEGQDKRVYYGEELSLTVVAIWGPEMTDEMFIQRDISKGVSVLIDKDPECACEETFESIEIAGVKAIYDETEGKYQFLWPEGVVINDKALYQDAQAKLSVFYRCFGPLLSVH